MIAERSVIAPEEKEQRLWVDAPPPDNCAIQWLAWDPDGIRLAAVASEPFSKRNGFSSPTGRLLMFEPRSMSWGNELPASPLLFPESVAWLDNRVLAVLEPSGVVLCQSDVRYRILELPMDGAEPT